MLPVILGLLLAIPIAMVTSTTSSPRPGALLAIPEEVTPPRELIRANELFAATANGAASAIQLLRSDAALLEAHLATLPSAPTRARGQVDPDLAIARAKIEDAESVSEAMSYLTTKEVFAVLSSRRLLPQLINMQESTTPS
jgi:membrane glycosyltransferase